MKGDLKKAAIGLGMVILALAIALFSTTPKLEYIKDLNLTVNKTSTVELTLGNNYNEVRIAVNSSNSTEILRFSSLYTKASYSLETKTNNELWLPYGGTYYVSCITCSKAIKVDLRTEIYSSRGSLPLLVFSMVLGLVGGVYAMMSLASHFAKLALKRKEG